MNPIRSFRQWSSQWPEASRWALLVWGSCALVVGGLTWMSVKNYRARARPLAVGPAAPGARLSAARGLAAAEQVAEKFPADPALWAESGHLLLVMRGSAAAQKLLREASVAWPESGETREDLIEACWRAGAPGEARQWLARLPVASRAKLRMRILAELCEADSPDPGDLPADAREIVRAGVAALSGRPDSLRATNGRASLEHYATREGDFQETALRIRVLAARTQGEALPWAEQLAHVTGLFADRLDRVSRRGLGAGGAQEDRSEEALRRLLGQIDETPAAALAYTGWLAAQGREADALAWLQDGPTALAADPRLAARRVSLAFAVADLEEARRWLREGAWGRLPGNVVDLALAARLAQAKAHGGLAGELWRAALLATPRDTAGRRGLQRLAMEFGDLATVRMVFDALREKGDEAALLREQTVWSAQHDTAARRQLVAQRWRELEPELSGVYLNALAARRPAPPTAEEAAP